MINKHTGELCVHCGGPIWTETRHTGTHGRDTEYDDYCGDGCETTKRLSQISKDMDLAHRTLHRLEGEQKELRAVRSPIIIANEMLSAMESLCQTHGVSLDEAIQSIQTVRKLP